jgi:Family of unknown function (DUF6338)
VASVVLDADAVGQVVTYVAPGFLTFLGYRARYPAPSRPAGEVLLISVVASLPLVAGVAALLPGEQKATDFEYVALLLSVGWALGYFLAWLRGRRRVKALLERIGYRIQPEGTIYAQTLAEMSKEGTVVVELKDGRRIWGAPRNGPQSRDDGINELYLCYPKAEHHPGEWGSVGAGVIVPLSEVSSITLDEDPTHAPPQLAEEPSPA